MKKTKLKLQRRVAVDDVKRDEMMAILIRNKSAFDSVKDVFTVQRAVRISEGHGLVWKVVCDYVEKHNVLPSRAAIEANVHNEIKSNPEVIDHDELPIVDEFLDYAYHKEHGKVSKSRAAQESAVETCRTILEEQSVQDTHSELMRNGTFALDPSQTIDKARDDMAQIQSLTAVEIEKPFPDGWDTRERVSLFTTGNAVLDTFLGGGWQAGEILLFMGVFGSCKTTVTCNGVANLILYCARKWAEMQLAHETKMKRWRKRRKLAKINGTELPAKPKIGKKPVVVLAFTEGDKNTYRVRLLSNLATVTWKRLNTMDSVESLSNNKIPGKGKGTRYEKREFRTAAKTQNFRSEQRRVTAAVRLANEHLILIDFTASGESKLGKGGIPELANAMAGIFRRDRTITPIALYLDHLSAMANRMTIGKDDDGSMLRSILKNAPLQARDLIGKKFLIPVAIMHQLSGEANQRSATATFSHADAADCKSVAEFVDHAFVTGPANEKQLCVFANTKHRREPPSDRRVVRVLGQFNRIVDVSLKHFVDPVRRRILSREEEETLQTAAQQKSLKSDSYLLEAV